MTPIPVKSPKPLPEHEYTEKLLTMAFDMYADWRLPTEPYSFLELSRDQKKSWLERARDELAAQGITLAEEQTDEQN